LSTKQIRIAAQEKQPLGLICAGATGCIPRHLEVGQPMLQLTAAGCDVAGWMGFEPFRGREVVIQFALLLLLHIPVGKFL